MLRLDAHRNHRQARETQVGDHHLVEDDTQIPPMQITWCDPDLLARGSGGRTPSMRKRDDVAEPDET